jgi:hypothetical protein
LIGVKSRKIEIVLLAVALVSSLSLACGPNEEILKSGKDSPTPANVENPKTSIGQEIESMRTADFRFIWVIRRRDGGVIDTSDKAIIRTNTVEMNRRVVTDDEKAVIIGSNVAPFQENFDALAKAFAIEDLSQEPVPSPLPTREPTPKTPKVIQ